MTDKRKGGMPDEIFACNMSDEKDHGTWNTHGGIKHPQQRMCKYVRYDISPPVPDDVASALEAFKSYRGISSDAGEGYLFDKLEKHHIETIIRACLQPQKLVLEDDPIEDNEIKTGRCGQNINH